MHTDQLIRMVNQIGAFFEAMPDRPEAMENAAQHIKRFWEPRMRQALLEHLDTHGTDELNGFVAEAIRQHRPLLA